MKKPPHPYLVLFVALILPGCGQVLNRQPMRGLMFLFFTALLGTLTFITAPPTASLIGHLAGGVCIRPVDPRRLPHRPPTLDDLRQGLKAALSLRISDDRQVFRGQLVQHFRPMARIGVKKQAVTGL